MATLQSMSRLGQLIRRNLANFCSFLGVIPLFLLLDNDWFLYLPFFIIYNNIMDDLDGIVAKKLGIQSKFGARLDNVCDAIAHVLIAWVIAAHYAGIVAVFGVIASVSMIVRVASRLDDSTCNESGTSTNELMRHLLFFLLLEKYFQIPISWCLTAVFFIHSLSMIVPYRMPHLIRARAKTIFAIILINVSLVLAWQIPYSNPFILTCFVATYLYSFFFEGIAWLKCKR